jgi:hypothetical protein
MLLLSVVNKLNDLLITTGHYRFAKNAFKKLVFHIRDELLLGPWIPIPTTVVKMLSILERWTSLW